MKGAEVSDPAPFLLPRANLSPIATFPLTHGASLGIRMACYPRQKDETQPCSFNVGFRNPYGADIKLTDKSFKAQDTQGEDLVNIEFYEEFAERFRKYEGWPTVRDGEVFFRYSNHITLMLKETILPDRFVVQIPSIIVNSDIVVIPPIQLLRKENLTCQGVISNY